MESVDRLREYVHLHKSQLAGSDCMDTATSASSLVRLADAIEAEVEGRYMELPVGSDGRPIRPGETVYGSDGHEWLVTYLRIGRNHSVRVTDGTEGKALRPEWLTHVKPPTVEDVLREFADEYATYEWVGPAGLRGVGEELMAKYAARLRLADGGDAS